MASFFSNSNSENERDTSAMLQLRETLPTSYSEGLLSGNMMMYMNYSSSAGLYSSALPLNTHQQTGANDSRPSEQEIMSGLGSSRIQGNVLNEWKDTRSSNLLLMHQLESAAAAGVFQGAQNLQGGQGLSLTLGTHVPSGFHMSSFQGQSSDPGFSSIICANQSPDADGNRGHLGNANSSTNQQPISFGYLPPSDPTNNYNLMRSDPSPYGILSSTRSVPSPKYLKAAQELLDEVVNVKAALKEQNSKSKLMKDSREVDGGAHIGDSGASGTGSSPKEQESSSTLPAELSASEKQDLQNKLTKLLEMLDEVDRRYKQYYHQMQIVVSSFDIVAGSGASRPYTALALQTISRHFRCLRDAINEQIQTARKGLGEQDTSANSKGVGISRLRHIDKHIRQGRSIQQLGMMQQNAWRPQRGLPESSVSILRAWLFEHFLHPYPKDSDKMMLARQTGLSRSQVSNWFINARVRLWKPMVEEMYKEELGDVEMNANSPSEFTAKATSSDAKASEDDLQQSTTSTSAKHTNNQQVFESRSGHLSDSQWMEPRTNHTVQEMSPMETENQYRLGKARGIEISSMNDCNSLQDSTFVHSNEGNDRLMAAAYHISELGRFENGSGVSLTLGLQQCEGSNIPMSIETHQSYGTIRDGMYSTTAPSVGPDGGEFDCLDSGNRHHRFSSSQLLHDFVA